MEFNSFNFFLAIMIMIKASYSAIVIEYPYSLLQIFPQGINSNVATFGDIPYGLQTLGHFYYDFENKDAEMACNGVKGLNLEKNDFLNDYNPFLLVDRGTCSFVTKARNAQKIGAKALIIINNKEEDINDVYMMDDGTGKDINIPTLLISKEDGDKLKKFFKENNFEEKTKISLTFEISRSDDVNFEIIFSSTNLEIYELLFNLKPYLNEFNKDKFHFYPVYYTQADPNWKPHFLLKPGEEQKKIDNPDCFGNGHFCYFFDFEAAALGVINGRQVILEDLRQICIFKERNDITISEYIDYMKSFYDTCLNVNEPDFSEKCSISAMKKIGYSSEKINSIENCINNSFEDSTPSQRPFSKNTILHKEKAFMRKTNVVINPSVIVDRKLIYVSFYYFRGQELYTIS